MIVKKTLLFISLLFLSGCISIQATELDSGLPLGFPSIPKDSRQVLVVEPNGFDPKKAVVTLWEKRGSLWIMQGNAMPVVVGRNGIAPFGAKKEGDGRTPSGIFTLTTAFGYENKIQTGLNYRQATANDFWVDDVNSSLYNQWVVGDPKARSFERMKRDDDLYQYGIVIDYNTSPIISGNGSAIFFHVWRGPDKPTSGCIATSKKDVLRIMRWLRSDQRPCILIKSR